MKIYIPTRLGRFKILVGNLLAPTLWLKVKKNYVCVFLYKKHFSVAFDPVFKK